MASICYEEEELKLLRLLDLFSLALKNTVGPETSGLQQQQQQQNLDPPLEQAFSGMPTKVKATVWYSKLRIEWEKKISEYRLLKKSCFPDKDSKVSVEAKVTATTSNSSDSKNPLLPLPQPLIKSKLQPTAVEFTPRFLPHLPPFLVEGIGGLSPAISSSSSYLGTETITETKPNPTNPQNPNQTEPTEHVYHHHFHHHFLHHSSPNFNFFGWPAAPTTPTLPAIPFFSSNSSSRYSQQRAVVVAPDLLRFQILSLIALFPPVTSPTQMADLNNLFAAVAFTARWIFDYLDDDLFQTAVFQGFFSRMPALLQEHFVNPSQLEPGKPYEPKLVNLIAFLRRFLLSLRMREKAEMSRRQADADNKEESRESSKGRGKAKARQRKAQKKKKKKEDKSQGRLPLPTRYCAFCKQQTSHNIVGCPFRTEALCHRCFLTGHTMRYCRNPSLLPPAWLNSGQIKFEEEDEDTFLLLHPTQ
ncbi:hypothetical protein TYRP_014757 [Tyrophagus putrescentiae]|nr:hypothetical protein TYRP_014757 [Tyrophagus putrescentiae]